MRRRQCLKIVLLRYTTGILFSPERDDEKIAFKNSDISERFAKAVSLHRLQTQYNRGYTGVCLLAEYAKTLDRFSQNSMTGGTWFTPETIRFRW